MPASAALDVCIDYTIANRALSGGRARKRRGKDAQGTWPRVKLCEVSAGVCSTAVVIILSRCHKERKRRVRVARALMTRTFEVMEGEL